MQTSTLNCASCPSNCCKNPDVDAPILLPFEVELFEKNQREADGPLWRLKRNPKTGHCAFLSGNRCLIYDSRPEECRLFPYVFDYFQGQLSLVLVEACPHKQGAVKPVLTAAMRRIPLSWWAAHAKARAAKE